MPPFPLFFFIVAHARAENIAYSVFLIAFFLLQNAPRFFLTSPAFYAILFLQKNNTGERQTAVTAPTARR
jgi:hypothetical protein